LSKTLRWTENETDLSFESQTLAENTQPETTTGIDSNEVLEGKTDFVHSNQNNENNDIMVPAIDTTQNGTNNEQRTVTRSGRVSVPTERMRESVHQRQQGIVSLLVEWEVFHDESYEIQDKMENPIAFLASTNPDVMYLDQAMREPDRPQFEEAMVKEVSAHTENGNWIIVSKKDVPKDNKILPAVWAMRRKRRITTGEVYKWKARLNIHGGKQEYGVNYWETYAPVISWTTIRLYLVLAILNKRATRQIDFVLAYPQAEVECDLYMEIPKGFVFEHGDRNSHCLLLKRNLYGQKQAGRVWNQYLHDGLIARGFQQSEVDMCLYYHSKHQVNLLIYTDDGILTGRSEKDIDAVIELMRQPAGTNKELRPFDMTDEGEITDYLGVKVDRMPDGTIKLSQPHLIQQVIDDLGFNERTKGKSTPAKSTDRLHRDVHGDPMNEKWHYRSVIGKLNFIEKSTRPDIAYAVHQCARFSNDPKASHASAVKHIVKYLMTTKDEGIYLRPDDHSFDCWVDADFVGNWNKVHADIDPSTAKSRTGFVINYAGCPITWGSKLQTEVALSTTEAEYNALSTSLREVIHLMQIITEAKDLGWQVYTGVPIVHCKVFEDNVGALEMARLPKMRPRTKHLCIRLHHFREHVRKKLISIHHITTHLQIADLLTKPQPKDLFIAQREILMRWPTDNVSVTEGKRDSAENIQSTPSTNHPNSNHLRACGILETVNIAPNEMSATSHETERSDVINEDVSMKSNSDSGGTEEETKFEKEMGQRNEELLAPELQTYQASMVQTYENNLQIVRIYEDKDSKVPVEGEQILSVEIPYTLVQKSGRKKGKMKKSRADGNHF
jgi:hypothetical protein